MNVKVLFAVRVFPFAIVRVPVVDEMVKPFILFAVATPKEGVVKVGLVAKTKDPPVPVLDVIAENRFAELGVPKKVATPVPNPLIPDATGT